MPTQITKWKSPDGLEFSSLEECAKYEDALSAVGSILRRLGSRPDSCDFSNGSGWLQHKQTTVASVRAELISLTRPHVQWWFKDHLEKHGYEPVNAHPSWFMRILDGSAPCIERAWYRLCCIDEEFKEWGQPYYAMNKDNRPKDAVELYKET